MLFNLIYVVLVLLTSLSSVGAQNGNINSIVHKSTTTGPDAYGKYTIQGTNIRASFVTYGAGLSNLYINDTSGTERDVVGGLEYAANYTVGYLHHHFGGIPGRYANRIKGASFELDGITYNLLPNEDVQPGFPNGTNQVHGGPDGWDWRIWSIVAQSDNSITFGLTDPDGDQGFPGEVTCTVKYTLGNMTWDLELNAVALTKATPIMLTQHGYWNLDGFANPETATAFNHSLFLPYSGQRIETDPTLIPTGNILANQPGSVNDWWSSPKQFGANITSPDLLGNCGLNCTGYDTDYLVNRHGPYNWRTSGPVARLRSAWSGIQMDVYSDQDALQIYSCHGEGGFVDLKSTQGLFNDPSRPRFLEKYGCVVIEVQDWIDGINQPEWQRSYKQIYRPGGDPYISQASYVFSLNSTAVGLHGQGSG